MSTIAERNAARAASEPLARVLGQRPTKAEERRRIKDASKADVDRQLEEMQQKLAAGEELDLSFHWPAPIPEGCPYTGWTREGDSWFSPSITDLSEPFHRVDMLLGNFYCTCQGYQRWKQCKHCSRALAEVMDEMINKEEGIE